jgi:hypothetical protein
MAVRVALIQYLLLVQPAAYHPAASEIVPHVLQIASRISQLYYHNYIRTGQFPFLYDSYVFYEAIASREYFKVS